MWSFWLWISSFLFVVEFTCGTDRGSWSCSFCEQVDQIEPAVLKDRSLKKKTYKHLRLIERECGRKPKFADKASYKRITGGKECIQGSWPWMVGIFVQESSQYFKCGAALISDRWVLSAGHCGVTQASILGFSKLQASQISVRLGMHNVSVKNKTVQEIPAKRIIYHPKWAIITKNTTAGRKMIMSKDLMLIELKHPAKVNERVQPICLRKKGFEDKGTLCYVAGWGTAKVGGSVQGVLHETTMPIVNIAECNKTKAYSGVLTDDVICAGFAKGGKDTCEGDSGGPLMCQDSTDKRWYVAGVASSGQTGCGLPGVYGLYSSIGREYARKWIEKYTKQTFL